MSWTATAVVLAVSGLLFCCAALSDRIAAMVLATLALVFGVLD